MTFSSKLLAWANYFMFSESFSSALLGVGDSLA